MERTVAASRSFDFKNHDKKDVDTLKLSSGDIMVGEDVVINKAAILFQNFIGIKSSAIGNHEHDMQGNVDKVLQYVKYNLLSNNIKINPRSPWSRLVKSSVVEEVNGHKYGIIGTTPVDLYTRSKLGTLQQDISVDDAVETLKDIQKEADKLKAQGVNKIILLSHLGNKLEKIVATQTTGVDVILGGHSHNLIFDVKEGENLFYNKAGEPVIITQAGKDGKNFGILNLEFDKDGIIKKVQNNIGFSKDFHRDMPVKYVFDKLFVNNKVYGVINSAPPEPERYLISPNPHGNFIADCMKEDLGVDIALIQSANMRGYFEKGKIDERILNDILPFKNELYKVNYSEKEIVDALKFSCEKSFASSANKPGIFYVSGLEYSVSQNGKLQSLYFINKHGYKEQIDINNPRTDKFYTTAINDYCAQGNDKLVMLNHPDRIIEKCGIDSGVCVARILEKSKTPVDIKDDGRIKIA
jgi:5'-nucleotidase